MSESSKIMSERKLENYEWAKARKLWVSESSKDLFIVLSLFIFHFYLLILFTAINKWSLLKVMLNERKLEKVMLNERKLENYIKRSQKRTRNHQKCKNYEWAKARKLWVSTFIYLFCSLPSNIDWSEKRTRNHQKMLEWSHKGVQRSFWTKKR